MRQRPATPSRPSIAVHIHDSLTDDALTDLLLGIEEEAVPVEVTRSTELNPLKLAHSAARHSQLGVGVGVSLDYAVVTLDKLPEDRPYLAYGWGADQLRDRITGANAARLVKRLPLRPEHERNP